MVEFNAVVELNGRTATGIEVPAGVLDALAGGRRPAVVVTIGSYSYRTTVGSMGGRSMIPVSAENRAAAGVSAGDAVSVTIEPDAAPRTVDVPADLAAALAAAGVRERFDALAFSHRKEHVRAIEDAKTDATRQRRIAKAVEKLVG
ncbi:YdeI/OmpD-associated family protein [Spongisporangium articulatum]|uniref:YdeI/OmpD-associated family protein n=1 Tax=Spongisporangium articulatum TaxID=3362603 RepID=A0ABW8AS55_9ACTN